VRIKKQGWELRDRWAVSQRDDHGDHLRRTTRSAIRYLKASGIRLNNVGDWLEAIEQTQ